MNISYAGFQSVKPSKDAGSLPVCIKKYWKVMNFVFFIGDFIGRIGFTPF